MTGGKDYQIDIEVPEETLRSYGVSLQKLAQVVRRENFQLPGGTLRADSQEVLLRAHNRRLTGEEIAKLPLITDPDGAVLRIGDIGTVRDAFTDLAATSEFNGHPVLVLSVQRNTSEDLLSMVDHVKDFVRTYEPPSGYQLVTWGDRSVEVRSRVRLLTVNGLQGLAIVFMLLAIFLDLRLAFWIAHGNSIFAVDERRVPVFHRTYAQHDIHVRFHHGLGNRGRRRDRDWRKHLCPPSNGQDVQTAQQSKEPVRWHRR